MISSFPAVGIKCSPGNSLGGVEGVDDDEVESPPKSRNFFFIFLGASSVSCTAPDSDSELFSTSWIGPALGKITDRGLSSSLDFSSDNEKPIMYNRKVVRV